MPIFGSIGAIFHPVRRSTQKRGNLNNLGRKRKDGCFQSQLRQHKWWRPLLSGMSSGRYEWLRKLSVAATLAKHSNHNGMYTCWSLDRRVCCIEQPQRNPDNGTGYGLMKPTVQPFALSDSGRAGERVFAFYP